MNPSPPVREHLSPRQRARDWAAKCLIGLGYWVAPEQCAQHLKRKEVAETARQLGMTDFTDKSATEDNA